MLAKIGIPCTVLRQNAGFLHRQQAFYRLFAIYSLLKPVRKVYRMGRFEHPEALWSCRGRHTTPPST
jgi:hypothetical protein